MFEQYITPGWITLVISIIGFISFYFGKIILDFYPSNEDKSLHYIIGFILFLTYMLIPFLGFYYFRNYLLLNLNLLGFFGLWILYGFLSKYFSIKMNLFQIKRGLAEEYFQDIFSKNINKFGIHIWKLQKIRKLFTELPSQIKVIFLGYLTLWVIVNIIFYFHNLIITSFIFIATLSTFNNIIILHVAKNIPFYEVLITDVKNNKFKGRLIKKDSNYLLLNCEKEVYTFPRESVLNMNEIKKEIDITNVEKKIDKFAQIWNQFIKKSKNRKLK